MEQLKEIYDSLDSVKQQQFHIACSPDNYINIEVVNGHTIISHSKIKSNNSVVVKNPLAVLHASNIIFHTPDEKSIQTIKNIIQHIDLQCTDPKMTNIDIEAGERLLDELNNMSIDDNETLSMYIERIEDIVSNLTHFVTNNKPVHDYITNIINNDIDENKKQNYEHIDIYDAIIAEKNENELMILFHEININISRHMILIFKLNTMYDELIEKNKNPSHFSIIQNQIDKFQNQLDNNEKIDYDQYAKLILLYTEKEDVNIRNNLSSIIIKLGNKITDDMQIEKIIEEKYNEIFVSIVTIMSSIVTLMQVFIVEKNEMFEIFKQNNNTNKSEEEKISIIISNIEKITEIFKKCDNFKNEMLKKIEKTV